MSMNLENKGGFREDWGIERDALRSALETIREGTRHSFDIEASNTQAREGARLAFTVADHALTRGGLYDVELKPRERTEPPWVTWAKRMKDSPKEWERLHRVERAARATRSDFRTPKRDHTASEMCNVIDAVELERIQEFQGSRKESVAREAMVKP